MSQSYTCAGETIWEVSTAPSRLFLAAAERAADELGLPLGIGEAVGDTYDINAGAFEAFATALLRRLASSNHEVWHVLADGIACVSMGLLFRIRGQWLPMTVDKNADTSALQVGTGREPSGAFVSQLLARAEHVERTMGR